MMSKPDPRCPLHTLALQLIPTQAHSHNEANEAVASPKISKKNLPQMKNS